MTSIGTRARDLAAAVTAGERSAVDVVNDHLDHIDAHEADVRAFTLLTADAARERAAEIDRAIAAGDPVGPLAGVPIALKDNVVTRGVATTASSRILQGWIPPYDATVVDRLRAAGAITVGKANLDEFAMGSTTRSSALGPTRNPVDPTRMPGGSSGGSAAAVAADFTPLSIGTDTGGSIRQPASHCGIVGVKPTYGRVSRHGIIALGSSLDTVGPLAADVADAALLHDVLVGHDPLDATSRPEPVEPVTSHLDDGVDGRRIGIVTELLHDPVRPEVAERVRAAADALAAAGAEIVEVSVPAVRAALLAYKLIVNAEASSNLARYDGIRHGLRIDADTTDEMMTATRTAGFGHDVKLRLVLGTLALSTGRFDDLFDRARRVRTLVIEQLAAAHEGVDLLLAPVAPDVAPRLDEDIAPEDTYLENLPVVPANLAGVPAISVPFGTVDALPVGVQITARQLDEVSLFAAASVLEAAAPARAARVVSAPGG